MATSMFIGLQLDGFTARLVDGIGTPCRLAA
jgi:hypothetical protein